MRVEFRILGPIEVTDAGRPLPLGGPKQRALLALLLLHANEVVPTATLIDAVWGESPPATVETILHGYVSKLRRVVGPRLATKPPGYVLRVGDGELDARRFDRLVTEARDAEPVERASRLREALALWRGPALVDFRYDDFAQADIARLDELRVATTEQRVDADLQVGRHAELVGELEALVREHPLRERLRAQLMLALYRAGRQVEALEAYRDARRTLVEEAGVEPGSALRKLERRILAQDEALAAPEPIPASVPPRQSRRRLVVGAAITAVAVAVAAASAVSRKHEAPVEVPPRSVAVLDPERNRVVDVVAVGAQDVTVAVPETAVAVGGGWLWVANAGSRTVTRVDLRSHETETSAVAVEPFALAIGAGTLWIAGRTDGLGRASVASPSVGDTVRLTADGLTNAEDVVAARRDVWTLGIRPGGAMTIIRHDPETGEPVAREGVARGSTGGLAVTADAVWVTSTLQNLVRRISRDTGRPVDSIRVPAPTAIAAGADAVWVVSTIDDAVWRIDPATNLANEIRVPHGPTGVAVDASAVWVAHYDSGDVTRIDAARRTVAETIHIADTVSGVAAAGGKVWVVVPDAPRQSRQTLP
jgi:DNA-binding SARP family transcriptional activator